MTFDRTRHVVRVRARVYGVCDYIVWCVPGMRRTRHERACARTLSMDTRTHASRGIPTSMSTLSSETQGARARAERSRGHCKRVRTRARIFLVCLWCRDSAVCVRVCLYASKRTNAEIRESIVFEKFAYRRTTGASRVHMNELQALWENVDTRRSLCACAYTRIYFGTISPSQQTSRMGKYG